VKNKLVVFILVILSIFGIWFCINRPNKPVSQPPEPQAQSKTQAELDDELFEEVYEKYGKSAEELVNAERNNPPKKKNKVESRAEFTNTDILQSKNPSGLSDNIFNNMDFLFGRSVQELKELEITLNVIDDHIFDVYVTLADVNYFLRISEALTADDIMAKGRAGLRDKLYADYYQYYGTTLNVEKSFHIKNNKVVYRYDPGSEYFYLYKHKNNDPVFVD